jgi:hypothetical protein
MRSIHPTTVGAAILCAGLATATGALAEGNFATTWRQVDNRFSSASGAATGLAGNWLTYDLYLTGDVGTRINAINMGYAADPSVHSEYIFQNGTVYQHAQNPGYFAPPPGAFPFAPSMEFDSYVGLGDTPSNAITALDESMNLTGFALRGIWFATPGTPDWPATMGDSGEMFLMRLTVSSDTTQIGGYSSRIQVGTILDGNPAEPTLFISVPVSALLIVPSPSSMGCIALAAIAFTRRRR